MRDEDALAAIEPQEIPVPLATSVCRRLGQSRAPHTPRSFASLSVHLKTTGVMAGPPKL